MGILACAGLGTAIFFVFQASKSSQTASFVPDITKDFEADAKAFNSALERKIAERTADPSASQSTEFADAESEKEYKSSREVAAVRDEVVKYVEFLKNSSNPIVLDNDGFRETVEKRTNIDFMRSLSLKLTLQQGNPEAESEGYGTLLGVDVDPDQMSATAHWLFYTTASHAMSVQWFLAKKQNRWVVYDWQRLEYGRRFSEEFANYYSNLYKDEVDGYDQVLEELVKAIEQTDEKKLKRILRSAEKKKVLSKDFDESRLRLSWTYMQSYEYPDAKRVLLALRERNKLWGFYPTLAHIEQSLGNSDAHIEAARQFSRLSPNHPIASSMIGKYEIDHDGTTESYRKLLNAWALCPKDYSCLQALARGLPESLAVELLQVAWRCDSTGETLGTAINLLDYQGALTDTLVDQLAESQLLEQAWLDFLRLRIETKLNQLTDRLDSQAVAMRRAADGSLKETIDDWYMTRCFEDERFDSILADEVMAGKVLQSVATELEYDEWYSSTNKLIAALESAPPHCQNHPLFKGVLGGLLSMDDDPRAIGFLAEYLKENKEHLQKLIEDEASEDNLYFADWVESTLGMSFAKAGRVQEAIELFSENTSVLSNVVDVALSIRDGESLKSLRSALEKLDQPYTNHLVSKIDAYQSYWDGDFEKGDRSFADACKNLQAGQASDDSQSWMVTQLARLRGEFAVRSGYFDLPIEKDELGATELIQSLLEECGRLNDSNGLNKIVSRLESLELDNKLIDVSIAKARYQIAIEAASGRDICIRHLEELLEFKTQDIDEWYWETYANRLVRLYAEAGRWEDCDALIRMIEGKKFDSVLENQLLALLARDQQDEFESLLSTATESDVSSAMASPAIRKLLRAKPALHETLNRMTLELPRQWFSEDMRYNSATVGLSAPRDISETELQRIAAEHLPGATISIRKLPELDVPLSKSDDSPPKLNRWLIESSEGDTIFLVESTGSKKADSTAPLPFRNKLATVQHWIQVVVAESKRPPFPLQWNIANDLAGDAISIQWDYGLQAIWYEEPFKFLMEDPMRIPVTPTTLTDVYLSDDENEEEQSESAFLDLHDTKNSLQKGETVEVECNIYSFGLIVGKFRAKVIQIHSSTNRIEAELLEGIDFDPLFQPGQHIWLESYQARAVTAAVPVPTALQP